MRKLFVILLLITNVCSAQTHIVDSLKKQIQQTDNDSIKIDLYNKLAWKYIFSDKEKAIETLAEVEKIASKKGQEYGYNSYLNVKGVYYDVNGMSDSAKVMFEESLQFSIDNNFLDHHEHSLNNLGMYSWNKGNYQGALDYYFQSLKLGEADQKGDSQKLLDANYNNIGLIYQDMELYDKAIPYHEKALKIRIKKNFAQGMAASYNNLGICFTKAKKYKQAEKSLKKGMLKAKETNDQIVYFEIIEALAELYSLEDRNQEALALYGESYNRPESVSFNANDKVNTLSGLARLHLAQKQYAKAIEFGEECIAEINRDTTINFLEIDIYKTLAQAYFVTGNVKKGNFYNEKFYTNTSDKFNASTAEALQELETKYDTQKKELALQKSRAKVKQKNVVIFSSLGLAFLLGLIGYLVYKQQRIRNEQLVKENELKQALIKIENQNNLQEQRLAISKELHDNIGSQLTFIISSLDNLKQFDVEHEPIFDKIDTIGGFTRDTITDLRDTIWAMNKEDITFADLKERTIRFIERANTSLNTIDFQFLYPKESDEVALNSKLGIDVYRIIQEAVNNAVKHAQASKIGVVFEQHVNQIEVSISDNGIGFDPNKLSDGHGLMSMKRRADVIDASFEISQLDPGSKLSLKFELS